MQSISLPWFALGLTVLLTGCSKGGAALEAEKTFNKPLQIVSPPTLLKLKSGEQVTVKVYNYQPGTEGRHDVIFKYADLLNRAIQHKIDNEDDIVEVNFALYKLSKQIYVGFNPDSKSYGQVLGKDFDGQNSEKLVESIRKAREQKVSIRFVFQNPVESEAKPITEADGEGIYEYFTKYSKEAPKNFVKRVRWGSAGKEQMHNKFITVRILRRKDKNAQYFPISHAVYISTANGDAFKEVKLEPSWDVAQSGILVRGHQKLHDAYKKYFDLIWENAETSMRDFRKAVEKEHLTSAGLNYSDEVFEAFFTPMPSSPQKGEKDEAGGVITQSDYSAAWVGKYNPIAKMVNQMMISGKTDRYVKLSGYWCGARPGTPNLFASLLHTKLAAMYADQGPKKKLVDIRSAFNNVVKNEDPICPIGAFNGQKMGAPTHEKNALFTFGDWFHTMVGSANFHEDEYLYKANNVLLIREEKTGERPIYLFIKDSFYHSFNSSRTQ